MATQGTKKTTAKKDDAALKTLEAEATGGNLIEVTFRDEKLRIDPEDLDDFELVDQLTKGLPMLALAVFVPDEDQRDRLLDTCEKNRRGNPKLSAVSELVGEIMQAVGAGK